MKKTRFYLIIVLILIIFSTEGLTFIENETLVIAGSSSSGDLPPPDGGSGGDTSGGSASGGLYMNYRIPLVFKTGSYAPTFISITSFQDGLPIIFGYESVLFPNNSVVLNVTEPLIINATAEPELTNGSLIQSYGPLQITVYHFAESEEKDDSFSYSPLVMSMWGRRYQSPFDNAKVMLVAGFNNTNIEIRYPNGTISYETIPFVGEVIELDVTNGTIIEANGPVGATFYFLTQDKGSYAFTSIPQFLWGKEYMLSPQPFIGDLSLDDNSTEIVISTMGEGNLSTLIISNLGSFDRLDVPSNSTASLKTNILRENEHYYDILGFSLETGLEANFSITMLYNYTVNSVIHISAVQYIALEKMKWAEIFYATQNFQNDYLSSVALEDSNPVIAFWVNKTHIGISNQFSVDKGDYFNLTYSGLYGFAGNGTFFASQTAPPPETNYWNSSANILYPMNLMSMKNTSTFFPSWYRFPNVNVKEILIFPEEPTELRKLKLDIIVQNNGSIPCAPFHVTVLVNESLKIHTLLEGLDINQSVSVDYEEFQWFGRKVLNVSIYVDSLSQIFELEEFDNGFEIMIEITRNWNIIYIGVTLGVIVFSYLVYRIVRALLKSSKKRKRRFDVIVSDVEI